MARIKAAIGLLKSLPADTKAPAIKSFINGNPDKVDKLIEPVDSATTTLFQCYPELAHGIVTHHADGRHAEVFETWLAEPPPWALGRD